MEHFNEFAKDLKIIIRTLNISESFLAKELGINTPGVSNWLKGNYQPDRRSMEDVYRYAYEKGLRINSAHEEPFRALLKQNDQILLFHGSKNRISEELSLRYSKNRNDFGVGFYCGQNYKQAAGFVADYPDPAVYAYGINIRKFKVLHFDINIDWALTIAYYRGFLNNHTDSSILRKLIQPTQNCDLIIAPIANNRIFDQIRMFTDGLISAEACTAALSALDLGNQYVFKNPETLSRIGYLKQFYLCKDEKNDLLKEANRQQNRSVNKLNDIYRQYRNGHFIEDLLYE